MSPFIVLLCGHRETLPTGGAAGPYCLIANLSASSNQIPTTQRSCVFIPTWRDEQITLCEIDGGSWDQVLLVWIPAEKRCSHQLLVIVLNLLQGWRLKGGYRKLFLFIFPALMQNPVLRTFLTNLSSCSKSLCGLKKGSSEGPWINARDDTDPITSDAGQFKGGGSAAHGDYVGLGCCELDHIAQSNGPLRKGGKAKGWRLRNALFSALLWRPSIRPLTFPFSLPLLAPPPLPPSHRIYSSFLLPPTFANPPLIPLSFILHVLLSRSPACFFLLLIVWFPLCGRLICSSI